MYSIAKGLFHPFFISMKMLRVAVLSLISIERWAMNCLKMCFFFAFSFVAIFCGAKRLFLSFGGWQFFMSLKIVFIQLIKALALIVIVVAIADCFKERRGGEINNLEIRNVWILTGLHQNFFPNCTKNSRLTGSNRSDGLKPRFFSMIQLLVLFERRRWKTGVWLKFRLGNRDALYDGVLSERCIVNVHTQRCDLMVFIRNDD